jgi:hypothetical protein
VKSGKMVQNTLYRASLWNKRPRQVYFVLSYPTSPYVCVGTCMYDMFAMVVVCGFPVFALLKKLITFPPFSISFSSLSFLGVFAGMWELENGHLSRLEKRLVDLLVRYSRLGEEMEWDMARTRRSRNRS